jgi:chromatin assembly factor 1 subunit A
VPYVIVLTTRLLTNVLYSSMLTSGLARNIRKILIPDSDANAVDKCPLPVIEAALNTVAERVNYGLDSTVTSLCEWRWEAKDYDMLPSDLHDKLNARRVERVKVHFGCTQLSFHG